MRSYMKKNIIYNGDFLVENFYDCLNSLKSFLYSNNLLKKDKHIYVEYVEKNYREFQNMDDKIVISRRSCNILKYWNFLYNKFFEKIIGGEKNITVGTIKKILNYDALKEQNEKLQKVEMDKIDMIKEFKKNIKEILIPFIVSDYKEEIELTDNEKLILGEIFREKNKDMKFLSINNIN